MRKSKNLKKLCELHFIPFINERRIEMPTYMLYMKAITYYQIGEKAKAKKMLKSLINRLLPFNLRLKVLWLYLCLVVAE